MAVGIIQEHKEFKKGDRVKCIAPYDDKEDAVGKLGTIISINHGLTTVEYDENIGGHSGSGASMVPGKSGHCWNYGTPRSYLVHVEDLVEIKDIKDMKIIRPTEEELEEAMDFVKQIQNDSHSYYKNHFTPKQLGLVKQIRKSPKKMFGEAVVYNDGRIFYIGGWANEDGKDYLMLLNYDGTGAGRAEFKNCEPVRDTFALRPSELRAYDHIRVFSTISDMGLKNFKRIAEKKRTSLQQIRSKEGDIKNLSEYVEKLDVLEKGASSAPLSVPDIIEHLEELKKIKKVANAYLTNDNYLVVETQMLHLSHNTEEYEEFEGNEVGKYVIAMPLNGTNGLQIFNLTHCYHEDSDYTDEDGNYEGSHMDHPNVSAGMPCLGENKDSLFSMRSAGNYFHMVDFLLLFLTLFPHDGDSPYMDAHEWIGNIVECDKDNPYARRGRLWELYPPERRRGVSPRTLDKIASLQASSSDDKKSSIYDEVVIRDEEVRREEMRTAMTQAAILDEHYQLSGRDVLAQNAFYVLGAQSQPVGTLTSSGGTTSESATSEMTEREHDE